MESVALSRRFEKVSRFLAVGAGAVALLAALPPAAGADPVIAAAGDIACDPAGTTNPCRQMETSDLLVGAGLTRVLPVGDITQSGSASLANILALYDPSWGRVKSISQPDPWESRGLRERLLRLLQWRRRFGRTRGSARQGLVQLRRRQLAHRGAEFELYEAGGYHQRRGLRRRVGAGALAQGRSGGSSSQLHARLTGTIRATARDTTDRTRSRSRSGTRSRTPRPKSSCRVIATTTSASHRSIGTARRTRPTGSVSSWWERAARSSPGSGRPSRTARCPRTTPSAS